MLGNAAAVATITSQAATKAFRPVRIRLVKSTSSSDSLLMFWFQMLIESSRFGFLNPRDKNYSSGFKDP
jgi:hypothetical protein